MNQSNNVEIALISARATVMIYDDHMKKWQPSGTSTGLSKVQLLQHQINNTYRVVGRKLQDHEVVINCSLVKSLKYNQANQTFLQWRDSKQVYGLNFQSKEEAEQFTQCMKQAVDHLTRLSSLDQSQTLKQQQQLRMNDQLIYEDADRFSATNAHQFNRQSSSTNGTSSPSQMSIHSRHSSDYGSGPNLTLNNNTNHHNHHNNQTQTQQNDSNNSTITNQNKIYDVIQDSNISSNSGLKMSSNPAPTPPPPPPPPPMPSNLFSNEQIQTNSNTTILNSAPPPPPLNGLAAVLNNTNSSNEDNRILRNIKKESVDQVVRPQQIDFLTEIRLRLERKNQMLQQQQQQKETQSNGINENDSYRSTHTNGYRPTRSQQNSTSTTKLHNNIESPKGVKKNSSTTNVHGNGHINGYSNGHYAASNGTNNSQDSINYDKLKSEILTEIRKEMHTIKNDIINALVNELRKTSMN